MRVSRTLLAGAALAVAVASTAQAGTKIMATGPAARYYPMGQDLTCTVLNQNKTAQDVTVDVMDYYATVVATSGTVNLAPSTGTSQVDTTGLGAWCRFTVNGSTKKYRAAALYSISGVYTASIPAK
jgi:hypothetical protein